MSAVHRGSEENKGTTRSDYVFWVHCVVCAQQLLFFNLQDFCESENKTHTTRYGGRVPRLSVSLSSEFHPPWFLLSVTSHIRQLEGRVVSVSHPFSPTSLTVNKTTTFSLKINHVCHFNGILQTPAKNTQSSSSSSSVVFPRQPGNHKVISRSVSILTSPLWPSIYNVDSTAALRAQLAEGHWFYGNQADRSIQRWI